MIDVAEYQGRGIYEFASLVEKCAGNYGTFLEVLGDGGEQREQLFKPCRTTILHWYIYAMIWVEYGRSFRKNGDLYDRDDAKYWVDLAESYAIRMRSFDEVASDSDLRKQITADYGACSDELFYIWFLSQEDAFEQLWGHMTEEVFRVLFGNRRFLLTFNESLAAYLKDNSRILVGPSLSSAGRITRCTYIPRWLRNAIFLRDHGRCTLCLTDLTGLLTTENACHFDHIVPLNRFGTNDPVNFQLLCSSCNLRKAGGPAATSYLYPPWWSDVDDV